MPALKFWVEGDAADAAIAELEAFSQEQFHQKVQLVRTSPEAREAQKDSSIVPLLALVLAIPGATVHAMLLAERMKLRDRLRPLVALAGRLKAKGTVVRVETSAGQKDVATMTPDEIIDAASD
jgi:hypothetical protein